MMRWLIVMQILDLEDCRGLLISGLAVSVWRCTIALQSEFDHRALGDAHRDVAQ
jgi:hypothetical protein